MRIVYAGSPDIAVPALQRLVELEISGEHQLVGVLTNPDKPRGRHGRSEPTAVSAAVTELSEQGRGKTRIGQFKSQVLSPVLGDAIAGLQPDILVSFAYGRIFPPWFLGIFPQGGVNIHPSLLPRYRGPTPLQAAILAEDRETGITIQTLASAMDAGDILFQEPFPLTGEETTGELSALMGRKAADLLPLLLQGFAQGTLTGRPQDEEKATYCSLITKGDGRIDWTLSAHRIAAQIRAFTPWPLCWTMHEGQYLYILEGKPLCPGVEAAKPAAPGAVLGIDKHTGVLIQTGEGVLGVSRLQYGTKKALDWRVFLNGARNFLDSSLG